MRLIHNILFKVEEETPGSTGNLNKRLLVQFKEELGLEWEGVPKFVAGVAKVGQIIIFKLKRGVHVLIIIM